MHVVNKKILMKENILITGCGGYLGSYLIPYLYKKNYKITGYDIGFFKKCNLYKNQLLNKLIVYKDIRELSYREIEKCDKIIHLAGISNDPLNKLSSNSIYDPTRQYSLHLAKIAKKLGKKFIFASSCSVYGASKNKNYLNEKSNTNPQTGYSINKLQIEQDLEKIADKNFFPICLRFATIFGSSSRIRLDVVINMLAAMAFTKKKIILNSNGEAWRPHLHIDDACSAIDYALKYKKKKSDEKLLILNVGSEDNNLRIIDIAKILKKMVTGSEISFLKKIFLPSNDLLFDRKIKNGHDSRTYKVSFAKIKKKFKGFKCKYSVRTGINKMLKDFSKINLNKKDFSNKKFYRLQYLELLYKEKKINKFLKWKI